METKHVDHSSVIGGLCGTQKQSISIQWTTKEENNTMSVFFESNSTGNVFDYTLSDIVFNLHNGNESKLEFHFDGRKIRVSEGASYYCDSAQTTSLESSNAKLTMEKLRVEAFMTKRISLSEIADCTSRPTATSKKL